MTLTDSSVSAADADTIMDYTSGNVTATITSGSASTINTALTNATATDALTITLTDTTVAASDLNALNGKTSVAVNASSVTTLTGTYADVNTAYLAGVSGTISGLGNEAVTLSDTTLAASDLNALDGKTTGVINASSVTTLTGTLLLSIRLI